MDLDPTLPLPEILDHLQAGMTARVDEQGTVTPLLGGRFGHEHLPGPPMDRPREVTCAMLPDGVLNDHCRERSLHRQERRKSGGRRGRRANGFSWCASCKVTGDFVAAIVLFVLTVPLMVLSMILVKLTSRGPVIYSQTRLGRCGRPFTIYKIRTMLPNCEATTGPRWSTADDPRITPVGQFLRRTHLDELPQLWNILAVR